MTKNEYLITLAAKLQKLTDDPRKIYPELKSLIEFYQEMLDDKIEDGMTEEAAVAAMESPEEIVERLKREFGEMAAEENEAAEAETHEQTGVNAVMRREYNPEKVKLVRVIDADHGVKLVMGSQVAVNYEDDKNGKYEVSLEGGVLTLKYIAEKRSYMFFRNFFGWKNSGNEVTVELPNGWNGTADIRTSNAAVVARAAMNELMIHTTNGAIVLEESTIKHIIGKTSNGAIKLEGVTCGEMELGSSNGRIVANGICGSNVRLTSSNSSVNVQDAAVNDMFVKSSNAGLRLEKITGEKLHAQTSNGSIKVSGVNSEDVTLVSSNGSIAGDICGKQADYTITSRTSNGSNSLPNGEGGARKLDVRTSNGNISIGFSGEIAAEE